MSSSNKNGVYHLSLYLSSLSGHHSNPYNHQLTASPGQMVSAVPDSLMAFNSPSAEVWREVKKAAKKDRHSKIRTAQGLRDRRVRLSTEIARQFFDLQDMLGFDKASKTLDWLLKKSRKAINELVQERKLNNDDEDFGNNGGGVEEENDKSFVCGWSPEYCKEEVVCEVNKAEKRKKKSELISNISSKESFVKAKEITSKMTYAHRETVSEIMDPFNKSIIFNEGDDINHPFYKEAIKEFDNQEPILTKTKINLMGQSYNDQQDGKFMLMGQGSSSNFNMTTLPQNLDIDFDQNPFTDQPFVAVTGTNFTRGFPYKS